MLRRAVAIAALLGLAPGCGESADGDGDTLTVGGDRVAVATLVDAHAGLCEAAAQPGEARALFFDRSHEPLHTVARALEDLDRAQAAQLLEAKERVESELGARQADRDRLLRLADVYRASLGRLAITAPPCDK